MALWLFRGLGWALARCVIGYAVWVCFAWPMSSAELRRFVSRIPDAVRGEMALRPSIALKTATASDPCYNLRKRVASRLQGRCVLPRWWTLFKARRRRLPNLEPRRRHLCHVLASQHHLQSTFVCEVRDPPAWRVPLKYGDSGDRTRPTAEGFWLQRPPRRFIGAPDLCVVLVSQKTPLPHNKDSGGARLGRREGFGAEFGSLG